MFQGGWAASPGSRITFRLALTCWLSGVRLILRAFRSFLWRPQPDEDFTCRCRPRHPRRCQLWPPAILPHGFVLPLAQPLQTGPRLVVAALTPAQEPPGGETTQALDLPETKAPRIRFDDGTTIDLPENFMSFPKKKQEAIVSGLMKAMPPTGLTRTRKPFTQKPSNKFQA